MATLLIAGSIMTGLALFFGVVLATAYRYLRVEEDPRIEQVEELLPGSNCGACGEPGCKAFAEKVVKGEASPSQCTVSGPDVLEAIAAFLGVDAGAQEKRVARLHCAGGKGSVRQIADYNGFGTCRGAVIVNGGGKACMWGCLGLGDCELACTFDAIKMNREGLPVVDVDACCACNDCVDVCPLDLFTIEDLSDKLIVQCRSPLTGDLAKEICSVACDACGRCALDSPPDVIEMSGGLPVIKNPKDTTVEATFRCPTGAIQWLSGEQFQYDDEPIPSLIRSIRA